MTSLEEYILKRDAYRAASSRNEAEDVFLFYEREFSKAHSDYLAQYLINNGAFLIHLDDDRKDARVFEEVAFLLDRSKTLGLKRWFINYLKNINPGNWYYTFVKRLRNDLDAKIFRLIKERGFVAFVEECMRLLNSIKWGPVEIFEYGNDRNIENVSENTIVEAVSYLIKRAYLLNAGKIQSVSKSYYCSSINDVVNSSLSYLYSRQKVFESCLFDHTYEERLLGVNILPKRKSVEFFAGVIMNNIYLLQPIDWNNKPSHLPNLYLENARMIGIPYEKYFCYKISKNVSFHDISGFQRTFREEIEQLYPNLVCISDDQLYSLIQNRFLYDVLSTAPEHLNDLYQTPFLRIGDKQYFSSKFITHNRLEVNVTSAIYKKRLKETLIENKGTLFAQEVAEVLNNEALQVFTSRNFRISVNGSNDEGEIDVIALDGKSIHVFECKSELTPFDYYDYRRDIQIIDKATIQLDKINLFLSSQNGKKFLNTLFKKDVSKMPIKSSIVVSNSRTACVSNTNYPIYSIFEMRVAANNGRFYIRDDQINKKNKGYEEDFFNCLASKKLAMSISRSVQSYVSLTGFLVVHKTFEHYFNLIVFLNTISDQYNVVDVILRYGKTFSKYSPKSYKRILGLFILFLLIFTIFNYFLRIFH